MSIHDLNEGDSPIMWMQDASDEGIPVLVPVVAADGQPTIAAGVWTTKRPHCWWESDIRKAQHHTNPAVRVFIALHACQRVYRFAAGQGAHARHR